MSIFPQLNAAGMMVQLPFASTFSHLSSVSELQAGARQSYYWRPLPLMAWNLSYPTLSVAEYNTLLAFQQSQQGRYGEFTFLDPGGNLVPASELFSDASWTNSGVTLTSGQADPYGGTLATQGTAGSLKAQVLPSGFAGFLLCGSVWARAASGSPTLTVALVDSASAVQATTTVTLGAAWQRVSAAAILASGNAISLSLAWSGASIVLFGAQVAPLGAAGAYAKTPGNYGYHTKVRFDTDLLEPQYVGPNQVSLKCRLVEHG